jgi:uncharacterized protein (DUF1697 family)
MTQAMKHAALLRGINIGARNRVSMPELREHLGAQGYGDVQTIVASGNIVLESTAKPAQLEQHLRKTIAGRFGVDTPVIVRTARQIAGIVKKNPFPDAGGKELHVLFLPERCPAAAAKALGELDLEPEGFEIAGRDIYCFYGAGYQNSPLAKALDKHLRKTGTDRNWNTVLKLHDLLS